MGLAFVVYPALPSRIRSEVRLPPDQRILCSDCYE